MRACPFIITSVNVHLKLCIRYEIYIMCTVGLFEYVYTNTILIVIIKIDFDFASRDGQSLHITITAIHYRI